VARASLQFDLGTALIAAGEAAFDLVESRVHGVEPGVEAVHGFAAGFDEADEFFH
jgi:hypothetical protein